MKVKEIPLDKESSLFCYNVTESFVLEDINLKVNCNKKFLLGGGNLLVVERDKNAKSNFKNCVVSFNGEKSTVFIRKSSHDTSFNVSVHKGNTFYLGEDNYFNGQPNIVLSEGKNILIGDDCLFSYGLTFRTADPHLVYSCSSKIRINPSKSIFIGDHVWLGQNSLILKGATIGSGSFFGGLSVITAKRYFSNCAYGGNPAKLLKNDVFFTGSCVHNWGRQQTANNMHFNRDDFIFNKTETHIDSGDFMRSIDDALCDASSAWERFDILMDKIVRNNNKYRFVIQEPRSQETGTASADKQRPVVQEPRVLESVPFPKCLLRLLRFRPN